MKQCDHKNVQVMDYWTGYKPGHGERVVNRVCLRCGQHWHGGREYTRREWDALLDAAV